MASSGMWGHAAQGSVRVNGETGTSWARALTPLPRRAGLSLRGPSGSNALCSLLPLPSAAPAPTSPFSRLSLGCQILPRKASPSLSCVTFHSAVAPSSFPARPLMVQRRGARSCLPCRAYEGPLWLSRQPNALCIEIIRSQKVLACGALL